MSTDALCIKMIDDTQHSEYQNHQVLASVILWSYYSPEFKNTMFSALFVLLYAAAALGDTVIHVAVNVSEACHPCGSIYCPCPDLASALKLTNSTNGTFTLQVGPGTFAGRNNTGLKPIKSTSVTVIGASNYSTVLDGEFKSRIFFVVEATLTLVNLTITRGFSREFGGSVISLRSVVNAQSVHFIESIGLFGGAMAYLYESTGHVYNCTFQDNLASILTEPLPEDPNGAGGGMYIGCSHPVVEQTTFRTNRALGNSNSGFGGAVSIQSLDRCSTRPLFLDCDFTQNFAGPAGTLLGKECGNCFGQGGAVHTYGGESYCKSVAHVLCFDNVC